MLKKKIVSKTRLVDIIRSPTLFLEILYLLLSEHYPNELIALCSLEPNEIHVMDLTTSQERLKFSGAPLDVPPSNGNY